MRIAVIQASSQSNKNELIYNTVKKYTTSEVINFGCRLNEENSYSYIEISVLIGLLLSSKAVDFVVTGCSSGQGMMLACNSMSGVLCGYAPSPKDAYLFVQINNGNAISLPLGESYTWNGIDNFEETIKELFSEPFGQGYPKSEAERKLKDTELLKEIRHNSQIDIIDLLNSMDSNLIEKIMTKKDVIDYILQNSKRNDLSDWIKERILF
ncbi:MAG: RpiB/LacA/LacB family sugar-phosphate isomerase [Erysipelotrichaceae bacterium]|nr:RpiB/LacA/LacB family sugar-phosphate isomerase [Erysipelotrichaceae bacterium]